MSATIVYYTKDYKIRIKHEWNQVNDVSIEFKRSEVSNIKVVWKAGLNLSLTSSRKTEEFTTDALSCFLALEKFNVEDNYEKHLDDTLDCIHCVMNPEQSPDRRNWIFASEKLKPLLVTLLCYIIKRHSDDE